MKEELKEFIKKSEKIYIKEYLESIKNKIEIINSKNEKLSLLLLLTFVAYFLIENSLLTNVNLGIIEISKTDIGIIAIPPIFSFLIFYYFVLASHKSELLNTSNTLTHFYFKDEIKVSENKSEFGDLERLFLPFSFWTEIGKIFDNKNKNFGCLGFFLTLPLFGLLILPFWFIFYSVKVLILNYWEINFFAKIAVFLTIWFTIGTILYVISTGRSAAKSTFQDK